MSSSSWKTFNRGRRPRGGYITPDLLLWIVAGVIAALLGYGYFAFLDEVPLTHRTRWIATSPQYELELGDKEYEELIQPYRNDTLPTNHVAHQVVERVGSRVANAALEFAKYHNLTDHYDTQYLNQPYTYTVIESEMANAFGLPGNHIIVMTGLFQYLQNEDDLAAILGHEVAHILARHLGERESESLVLFWFAKLLSAVTSGLLGALVFWGSRLFRGLPHLRAQEFEADEIGLHLAAWACYDPRAATRVFSAIKTDEDQQHAKSTIFSTTPEFLSTHPSLEHRLTNFDKWMPDVMMLYNGEDGDRCRHVREEMKQCTWQLETQIGQQATKQQ